MMLYILLDKIIITFTSVVYSNGCGYVTYASSYLSHRVNLVENIKSY